MKSKKILITGGTGFIGSHLTELFVEKGYNVTVFDRYNPEYNLGNLKNSKYLKHIEFIFGDIRDYDSVSKAIKGKKNIIHLAALIGIPYSYYSPLAYIKTNIEGTYNVLEASKKFNVDQLIVTSTSETYGSAQTLPMSETHRLIAQSPYAASKISADQLAISYWKSFKLPVKIIRPFNAYGPRQSYRAVIPSIILQAINNNIINLGNINTTRDYTYVADLCEAFFQFSKAKKLYGTPINVGSNNEIKIKDIAKLIIKIINPKIKIKIEKKRIRPALSEVERLKCNNTFFRKEVNWRPKTTFDNGLKLTIKWFQEFKKNNFFNNYGI